MRLRIRVKKFKERATNLKNHKFSQASLFLLPFLLNRIRLNKQHKYM